MSGLPATQFNRTPFPSADETLRVSPADHMALYAGHQGMLLFRTPKVRVDFTLLAHPGIVLSRWYRVSDYRAGRVRAGRHSDIVRELSCVADQRIRSDRIAVTLLERIRVLVRVRDVVRDHRQHELAVRYSVIERVLGRAD